MALFRRPRLELGAPARSTPLEELELLAVDMETTGLNPGRDRIVSVGWVPVCGRVIDLAGAGYHVVRGAEVGESATIHLLTDDVLASGEAEDEVLKSLLAALRGRVLLAHFAGLEVGFVNAAARRHFGRVPRLEVVDTFGLERRHMERMGTYPRGEDLRLANVRARYGLPAYGSHNALGDALACAELYLAIVSGMRVGTLKEIQRGVQIKGT
ncbi:exonuclease domain-containing protein [Corynebacterium sp. HMSC04H06]|uniref:exonuclease domain-containing protein n=1 Tax=Corynebacterium sp. HMSC04H06 TaxID=1581050 RepID=UPI0008A1142A|nr:exonuclease domain-containing protein [Corynebacterium sp. HMSC04H06]OFS19086.1 DNA polymerase III subunit epsilon [Corynebacterium sp. HMSC04H06]